MGRGIMGDVFGDLFGASESSDDLGGSSDFGITGSAYRDLFAEDPIQGLPKTPFQFAVEDPAQDPFQFPFQYPNEDPSGGAYGPQYAPVDMPENLLQEVFDPLQEIDNLNPANRQSEYYPGDSLVENAYDVTQKAMEFMQPFDSLLPSALDNHPLMQMVDWAAAQLDNVSESLDAFDLTGAAKEQSQVGFASLLGEEPRATTPTSFENVLSSDDFSNLGQGGASGAMLGDQSASAEEIARAPGSNPTSEGMQNDLRGESDFDNVDLTPTIAVPAVDAIANDARGAEDFSDIGQATGQPLGEQYPDPGQLSASMEGVLDAGFQAWDDLRTDDAGGMGYAPSQEPDANSGLGDLTDLGDASPVMDAIEKQSTQGVDVTTPQIQSGDVLETTGADVLPSVPDLMDIAAAIPKAS